jgi:AcrR family transcriptional regulator
VIELGRSTMRTDAERNRARILEVARELLATSGDAPMHAIAQQAGVGQGTLYRHFPTRDALLLAVYRQDVEELIEAVPALIAAHPPLEALRLWCERLASFGPVKRGVIDALEAATRTDLKSEYHHQLVSAMEAILDAGKASGDVRPDATAEEVLLLVGCLWRVEGADWEARSRHMAGLIVDATRKRSETQA